MTRSQYKGKYLSGCVIKILTLCRIHKMFFFQKYHEKAEIHSFPTMYSKGVFLHLVNLLEILPLILLVLGAKA